MPCLGVPRSFSSIHTQFALFHYSIRSPSGAEIKRTGVVFMAALHAMEKPFISEFLIVNCEKMRRVSNPTASETASRLVPVSWRDIREIIRYSPSANVIAIK